MVDKDDEARGGESAGDIKTRPADSDYTTDLEPLLPSVEAAKVLGITPQTLRCWRWRNDGPPFVRYGGERGRVLYRPRDLRAWIERHVFGGAA